MSIKKIVVIGPESTGKSTLSEALASELQTMWVPEYARSYLKRIDRNYEENDLLAIAKGQLTQEDRLTQQANKYLICDTDLYVLKVWSEYKYHWCDKWILEAIAKRKYDLYLLTYIDIPWQDDEQREHPDPAMRDFFYNIYSDIVQSSGVQWADIRGNEAARIKTALGVIKEM